MANDLTGDFDVVAQFSIPAANRVLAAMHRGGRLPHSWSLRVDNYHHLDGLSNLTAVKTGIRSVVDAFGEAIIDPKVVAKPNFKPTSFGGVNPNFDFPVNMPKAAPFPPIPIRTSVSAEVDRAHLLTPAELERASHLVGVAEVQLGAPTISLGRSSTSIVVHSPVMARYTRDADTMEIPSFLHGEFQTTIDVQQVSSRAGMFINVKLAGTDGRASFVPKWVSPTWDSEPDQLGAINKALINALKTSFEPSSTPVPASIPIMQFKTLQGDSQPALAVMMDVPGGVLTGDVLAAALGLKTGIADPNSVSNVFLAEGDDFAMAVRSEDITNSFAAAVNEVIPRQQNFTTTTHAEGPWGIGSYTFHTFTTITTDDAIVEMQNGQIMVSVQVHVHFSNDSSFVPSPADFDFTVSQAFNLALNGGQVSLQTLGDLAVSISSNSITKQAKTAFTNAWNSAGGAIQNQIRSTLGADNLQKFLQSMMNPAAKPGSLPVEKLDPQLSYTWYEINPSGIVLHGTLQVPAWPKPHVEFAFRILPPTDRHVPISSGEYSALKSWIPGGTIQEFIWTGRAGAPLRDDHHTFLFHTTFASPVTLLCLTVKGTRITASGPITYQTVSANNVFCHWGLEVNARASALLGKASDLPKVALIRTSISGGIEVVGHASPWAPPGTVREKATSLIVHFPDAHSLSRLEALPRALQQVAREGTAAAIVIVVSPEQLPYTRPLDGVAFSDDQKAWADSVHFNEAPATFLIDTEGDVSWQHQGPLTFEEFVAALRAHLPSGGGFAPRVLRPSVRMGQPVPNFLFHPDADHELTLRRLTGNPVVLIFWKSTSRASLELVRDVERSIAGTRGQGPVLLAINDGEPVDVARKAAEGVNAVIVPDPEREISAVFGINVWPTTIYLDASGLVTDICFGRCCSKTEKTPECAATE
jgi:AhpC/TSA family